MGDTYWGTLARTMFTLFKSITGGISWHEAVLPLSNVGQFWVMVFVLYIAFCFFVLLNVVTGVFCQSAMENAQRDKELATLNLLGSQEDMRAGLRAVFHEIDDDNSGNITLGELEPFLKNPSAQAYLHALGIYA